MGMKPKEVVEIAGMLVGVAGGIKQLSEQKEFYIIPDMTGSDVWETKELLEEIGFTVLATSAAPNKKWIGKRGNEVVGMIPKAGKIKINTVINLIYVTEEVIDQSYGSVELPVLEGLLLEEALELLDKKGLIPTKVLADPDKKWAKKKPHTVIDSDPKPNLINKSVKTGTVVRVIYLDEEIIEKSKAIIKKEKQQWKDIQNNIDGAVKDAQKKVDDVGKQGQKLAGDALNNAGKVADQAFKGIQGIFFKKSKSQDKK